MSSLRCALLDNEHMASKRQVPRSQTPLGGYAEGAITENGVTLRLALAVHTAIGSATVTQELPSVENCTESTLWCAHAFVEPMPSWTIAVALAGNETGVALATPRSVAFGPTVNLALLL